MTLAQLHAVSVAGQILMFFGTGMTAFGVAGLPHPLAAELTGVPVTGTLAGWHETAGRKGTSYWPVYEFELDGRHRTTVGYGFATPLGTVGDPLPLLVQPRPPFEVTVGSRVERVRSMLGMPLVAAGLLAVGAWLVRVGKPSGEPGPVAVAARWCGFIGFVIGIAVVLTWAAVKRGVWHEATVVEVRQETDRRLGAVTRPVFEYQSHGRPERVASRRTHWLVRPYLVGDRVAVKLTLGPNPEAAESSLDSEPDARLRVSLAFATLVLMGGACAWVSRPPRTRPPAPPPDTPERTRPP